MTAPIQEPLKQCSSCKEEKPHSAFYKHYQTKDGLRSWCISCYKQKTYIYEQRSERRKEYLKERVRHTNPWGEKNPEKVSAHKAVAWAIKKGRLVRPSTCEKCGVSGRRIEAHHDDYAKRTEVRWFCNRCHRLHHTKLEVDAA